MTSNDVIHEKVQERYGAIASGSASSCCGDTSSDCCSTPVQLYEPEMLAGLPVDTVGLSLGCGDPVTIAGLQPGEVVLDLGSGGGIDCFLAARQVGLGRPEAKVLGIMMNTRALMELIVINVGYDLGVISQHLFTMLVIMAIASTVVTTPLIRRWLPLCAPDS